MAWERPSSLASWAWEIFFERGTAVKFSKRRPEAMVYSGRFAKTTYMFG